MLQFIKVIVTVYSKVEKFQYISCCSLSILETLHNNLDNWVSIHLMLQFIADGLVYCTSLTCFNTSHVVVYLKAYWSSAVCVISFNTSHVVVYHSCLVRPGILCFVSIHLMLQFINTKCAKHISKAQFQYISCCSLSLKRSFPSSTSCSFNTSHVVVYRNCGSSMWLGT